MGMLQIKDRGFTPTYISKGYTYISGTYGGSHINSIYPQRTSLTFEFKIGSNTYIPIPKEDCLLFEVRVPSVLGTADGFSFIGRIETSKLKKYTKTDTLTVRALYNGSEVAPMFNWTAPKISQLLSDKSYSRYAGAKRTVLGWDQ